MLSYWVSKCKSTCLGSFLVFPNPHYMEFLVRRWNILNKWWRAQHCGVDCNILLILHIRVPVWASADLLPISLLVNVPQNTAEYGQNTWAHATSMWDRMGFQALSYGQEHPGPLWPLGEWISEWNICLSIYLSLFISLLLSLMLSYYCMLVHSLIHQCLFRCVLLQILLIQHWIQVPQLPTAYILAKGDRQEVKIKLCGMADMNGVDKGKDAW